ncbi:MAG TPA: NAD-dependent epimerase/dehydratase family protein [Anaeromyxobacter sp.]|nr:NAD-dependent epimerase/dehydratase family protein [Anaeromyxobacter sp.]
MNNPLAQDLERALRSTAGVWEELREARILVTGGTGFFGGWLLETLLHANARLGLDVRATVLTRDAAAFRRRRPHLAGDPAVSLLEGDVLSLEPLDAPFTHVVHAATAASARLNAEEPAVMFETIVEGTRRVLEVARRSGARRLLFTSSGAVYGRQPAELSHVPEDWPGAPDPLASGSAYGEGKRAAELLCALGGGAHGYEAVIARCFAFAGPYLPLDAHFAIGNFVRDALRGGPIRVQGDGTPFRSYLYGADLASWLWTLLARGRGARAYHVGSEAAVSVRELALTVARVLEVGSGVKIAREAPPGGRAERYVPSTRRAREELGLAETFTLEEAIARMAEFARASRSGFPPPGGDAGAG